MSPRVFRRRALRVWLGVLAVLNFAVIWVAAWMIAGWYLAH